MCGGSHLNPVGVVWSSFTGVIVELFEATQLKCALSLKGQMPLCGQKEQKKDLKTCCFNHVSTWGGY